MVSNYSIYLLSLFHPALLVRIAFYRLNRVTRCPGAGGESKCSWCSSKDLHKLFNVVGQRNLCPLKSLTDKSKAKEAAKSIVDQKRADSAKDMQELLAGALAHFV
jgi:hypothetical protein